MYVPNLVQLHKFCNAPIEKVLCTYGKYLSGLQEKRIALCGKWAMRFIEKAYAFFCNGTALFQRRQVRFLDLPVRLLQIRAVR